MVFELLQEIEYACGIIQIRIERSFKAIKDAIKILNIFCDIKQDAFQDNAF